MSFANFSTLLVILSSKSLIYIKHYKCPNTDPCGTPLKTDFKFETSPSTTTRCLLSVSHYSIQSIVPSFIHWAFNLSSIFFVALCQKLSKNLRHIISTGAPSSIHMLCMTSLLGIHVEMNLIIYT